MNEMEALKFVEEFRSDIEKLHDEMQEELWKKIKAIDDKWCKRMIEYETIVNS